MNSESNGADVGFGRSISDKGSQLTWNARYGFPFVSYDDGWGIAQLTGSNWTIAQITRWTANVDAGWMKFTGQPAFSGDALTRAIKDLSAHPADAATIVIEAVGRYNGNDVHFSWDGTEWEGLPDDYVSNVLSYKNQYGF